MSIFFCLPYVFMGMSVLVSSMTRKAALHHLGALGSAQAPEGRVAEGRPLLH